MALSSWQCSNFLGYGHGSHPNPALLLLLSSYHRSDGHTLVSHVDIRMPPLYYYYVACLQAGLEGPGR
jgi:hypothetical protein